MQNNSNNNVYDNRRDTAKPPMPTTNRVIPRYDEFNNAPQYNNAKSRVNPGF